MVLDKDIDMTNRPGRPRLKGKHDWQRVGERKIIGENTWLAMEAPSLWVCCDVIAIA